MTENISKIVADKIQLGKIDDYYLVTGQSYSAGARLPITKEAADMWDEAHNLNGKGLSR